MIAHFHRLRRALPAPGWMALALVGGFLAGVLAGPAQAGAIALARLVGNLFIDGLRMTLLPLIFALVATSIAGLARSGGASSARIGRRLPVAMVALLLMACAVAALLGPALFALHPAPAGIAAAFAVAPVPPATPLSWPDTIRGFVPVNVVASVAQGALIPMVVFAAVLGVALGRLAPERADPVLAPLRGLADAMVMVVGWVLRVAPLGIFALAFAIGATAGTGAVTALGLYVLVQVAVAVTVIVLLYAVVRVVARVPLARFARAMAPAQAVAAGTQSSIAALPAMLASAERIGIPERDAGVTLSFAVSVFKITGSSGTLVTALGMAWLAGVEVGPAQLLAAVPLAMLATLTILGVPGPGSFLAATGPVTLALGAPIELLPIALAVDTIPDMFRTTANVTADVAVAAIVAPPLD